MASPGVLQSTRIKTTKGGVCIEKLQKLCGGLGDWIRLIHHVAYFTGLPLRAAA
jgi:hypothetical protein